jgi:hypothetical protein
MREASSAPSLTVEVVVVVVGRVSLGSTLPVIPSLGMSAFVSYNPLSFFFGVRKVLHPALVDVDGPANLFHVARLIPDGLPTLPSYPFSLKRWVGFYVLV